MRIGIFADSHDHLDNIRRAVTVFNQRDCEMVIFAGDLVSTIAIPPLRRLNCPLVGCFGDNEGNRIGVFSGISMVGQMADPPFGIRTPDGTRILVTHQRELVLGQLEGSDVVVFGHTHRAVIRSDSNERLFINPGETGGWTYRKPSVALLDTATLHADIFSLTDVELD